MTLASAYSSSDFKLTDPPSVDVITLEVPCFVRGTRIRTPRGEKRIETLRYSDEVSTAAGPHTLGWAPRLPGTSPQQ